MRLILILCIVLNSNIQAQNYTKSDSVLLNNYYDTIPPQSEWMWGEQVNRVNKYGFVEGKQIRFDSKGNLITITMFPEKVLYQQANYVWKAEFENDTLVLMSDSSGSEIRWFSNGIIEEAITQYRCGDDKFVSKYKANINGLVTETSLLRYYWKEDTSMFNHCFRKCRFVSELIYSFKYYNNGNPKYSFNNDTAIYWNENQTIRTKMYPDGSVTFNDGGKVIDRQFTWWEPGDSCSEDVQVKMVVSYELEDVIDLYVYKMIPNKRAEYFRWKWDQSGRRLVSASNWEGELPWKRFSEFNDLY
ncbi:MAG: hypothetical protein GC181_15860 [Bacteroidetes bacterium]|nr:hypothetical protein [Bacteroidota bacterium]